jgi:hypothetical protein
LKQLEGDEQEFKRGFKKLLEGDYFIHDRSILHTSLGDKVQLSIIVNFQEFVAVNEICVISTPILGKFVISILENIPSQNGSKTDYTQVTTSVAGNFDLEKN